MSGISSYAMKPLPQLPDERKWWEKSGKQPKKSGLTLTEVDNTGDPQSSSGSVCNTIRSFFAANNPFKRRGRQQLKRTLLSSGPAASRYDRLISSARTNDISGWRMGSLASCYVIGLCLLINAAFAIFVTIVDPPLEGIGTVYRGDCNKVKNLSRWLHFLVNILGTALLSASNFNMQCLSSPTRKEIEAVHIKGKWLDIGIPSIKNLRHISRKRVALWWLLVVSSLPLHFLWNSVVFSTLQANDYDALVVTQNFLQSGGPDCSNDNNSIWVWSDSGVACDMFNAAKANNLTKLEPEECIKEYWTDRQTRWSNVFVMLNTSILPTIYQISNWSSLLYELQSFGAGADWLCTYYNVEAASVQDGANNCTVSGVTENSNPWTWELGNETWSVDSCLALKSAEVCKLQYSSYILFIVIGSNVIKLLSVILTLKTVKEHHLITIGDAISSFLTNPDLESKGVCLATKADFLNKEGRAWSIDKASSFTWRCAPSRKWWAVCITLYLGTLIAGGILLKIGVDSLNQKGASNIWSMSFGSVDQNSLVAFNDVTDYSGPFGIMGMTLLANSPQVVFSAIYFMYNGLYTCMLTSFEWSKFAQHKKALRVTSPTHVQRSTYWLQVPYAYGIPLAIAGSLMHWLISQSIFLARIDVYGPQGQIEAFVERTLSISTCGYSTSAILTALILGVVMLLALVITGQRKLDNGIPLVGSCSLAISAACHGPPGDQDAAFKPLKWGAVKHETDTELGHCCFTTYNVERPIQGHHYAGYKDD